MYKSCIICSKTQDQEHLTWAHFRSNVDFTYFTSVFEVRYTITIFTSKRFRCFLFFLQNKSQSDNILRILSPSCVTNKSLMYNVELNLIKLAQTKGIVGQLHHIIIWRSLSHYICIHEQNNLFSHAYLLVHASLRHTHLNPCDAYFRWQTRDYFCTWINMSLIW